MIRFLHNVVRVLLHEHPGACHTVWSAHGATYCWICECSVTDHPVPGYVLVEGSGSDSAPILQGRRGNVPTIAFFTPLAEAETTRCRIGLDQCEVRTAIADRDGVRRT